MHKNSLTTISCGGTSAANRAAVCARLCLYPCSSCGIHGRPAAHTLRIHVNIPSRRHPHALCVWHTCFHCAHRDAYLLVIYKKQVYIVYDIQYLSDGRQLAALCWFSLVVGVLRCFYHLVLGWSKSSRPRPFYQ